MPRRAPANATPSVRRAAGCACALAILLAVGAGARSSHAPAPVAPARQATLDSLRVVLERNDGATALRDGIDGLLAAARAAGDTVFTERLLLLRGRAVQGAGDPAAALADLARARELARATGDSAGLGRALLALALAREDLGEFRAAQALYAEALDVGRASGDAYVRGRGLLGVAWAHTFAGDYARAGSVYASVPAYSQAAGDTFGVLWAWNGLGLCQWHENRLREARATFARTAARAGAAGETYVEAAATNNLAGVLIHLGRPAEAVVRYREAWRLFEAAGRAHRGMPAAMNLAQYLRQLGRLTEAEAVVDSALARCEAPEFDRWVPGLVDVLVYIRLDQERPALAARLARDVLAHDREISDRRRIRLLLGLAHAMTDQDSLDTADAVLDQAERYDLAREDRKLRARTTRLRADVLLARDQPARAAAYLAREAATARAIGWVTRSLGLEVEAGTAFLAADRPDSARVYLDRALAAWEAARRQPDLAAWREQRGTYARDLFDALLDLVRRDDGARPAVVRDQEAFDLLQRFKARTLLERMLGSGRELAPTEPIDLASLQRRTLRPGELFCDVFVGAGRGLLFAVTCDTLAVLELAPRAAVGRAVKLAGDHLTDPTRPITLDLRAAAAPLLRGDHADRDRAALARLVAGAAVVVWSPDDAFHRLPVAALLDPSGETTVCRTPSATALAMLRARRPAAAAGPASVLAVAGLTDGDGRPLAGAAAEVAWLARRFAGVEAITGEPAARPFGARDPSGYDVLHLATHAEVDDHEPWAGALVFAPDTRLEAAEVAELELSARLAVLTSCTSAGGAVVAGEGVLGLASGFLAAGTENVVATLWPVSDRAALAFSWRFYDELADGRPVAAALRGSQRWLRGQAEFAHPFHWAGYVLLGAGDQTVAMTRRSSVADTTFLVVGLVLAAVAAAAVIVWRRRRARR